jgi:nucleoside-diphosphate-sugar epimerase
MSNTSLRLLGRYIARGLFFFIGPPGGSANYVEVSNVVDALVLCGRRPGAFARIYNLSDWCTVEDFAGAIAAALGVSPPTRRLPETPTRVLARLMSRVPRFPLRESRVNALVDRSRFSTDRIEHELGYRHGLSLALGLQRFFKLP